MTKWNPTRGAFALGSIAPSTALSMQAAGLSPSFIMWWPASNLLASRNEFLLGKSSELTVGSLSLLSTWLTPRSGAPHRDGPKHRLPRYWGTNLHVEKYRCPPQEPVAEWWTTSAYFIKGKPYVGCLVSDNMIPKEGEVLRSEIASAMYFIRKKMQSAKYNGSPIPVCHLVVGSLAALD